MPMVVTTRQSSSDAGAGHKHLAPLINMKGPGSTTDKLCKPAEGLQLTGHISCQPQQLGTGSHNEVKSPEEPFSG